MPADLELRARLIIEADTRGADQTKAALRGVRQEAAQTQQATAAAAATPTTPPPVVARATVGAPSVARPPAIAPITAPAAVSAIRSTFLAPPVTESVSQAARATAIPPSATEAPAPAAVIVGPTETQAAATSGTPLPVLPPLPQPAPPVTAAPTPTMPEPLPARPAPILAPPAPRSAVQATAGAPAVSDAQAQAVAGLSDAEARAAFALRRTAAAEGLVAQHLVAQQQVAEATAQATAPAPVVTPPVASFLPPARRAADIQQPQPPPAPATVAAATIGPPQPAPPPPIVQPVAPVAVSRPLAPAAPTQAAPASAVEKQGDEALAFLRQHPPARGGQVLAPAPTKLPQSALDAIRGTVAAGGSPKAAEAGLLALGADPATIAAVLGAGKDGKTAAPAPARTGQAVAPPAPPPTGPSAPLATPPAPRAPGGRSLRDTADDSEKVGRSFRLTDNEAVRFGASLIGLGVGISAFSFAGRILHDTLTGIVSAGVEAERQARITGVAFGAEAAGLTAFAQSVRESSGFTKEAILGAAGGAQALVSSGRITQAQLEQLVKVGAEYAQITGQDVGKTTLALADAVARGGDATGILDGKLNDVNVAAKYANGAFATTFKTLSDGEQSQIRFAYLMQLGADNTKAAGGELASLPGRIREANTSLNEAAVAASEWGIAARAVDLYVQSLKELARWSKQGLQAGDPSKDPVLAAILGAQAGQTNLDDQKQAFEQAQKEMQAKYPPVEGQTLSLVEGAARSEEMKARIAQLVEQKQAERQRSTITPPPRSVGAEDYSQPGGPWDVVRPGVTAPMPATTPPPPVVPNPYPQMLDQAQERGRRLAYAVTVAQRESLDLLGRITTAEQAALGPKGALLDIEYQINRATDHRLELLDQEKVLRATMANQGRQDALQSAQMEEQMLSLGASIRGPGRGEARAALRRFERAQTVPRAELAAMQGELPVTAAQRQARDDAANQQLALLPLQAQAATIQRGVDARQHDLDVLNLIREGDKLHADEIVLQLTAQQQANADTAESYRQLIKARDDYFTFGPGKPQPGIVPPPVSFTLGPGPAGAGGAFVINITSAVAVNGGTGDLDYDRLKQIAEDAGASAAVAAMVAAHQAAGSPSRPTEAGAR